MDRIDDADDKTHRRLIRLEDWEAEKMRDPEFRAAYEALGADDSAARLQIMQELSGADSDAQPKSETTGGAVWPCPLCKRLVAVGVLTCPCGYRLPKWLPDPRISKGL